MSRSFARELSRDERVQSVIIEALDAGWDAELTSNNHIKFTHPDVERVVFGPSSPSDYRAAKNLSSELKSSLRQSLDEKFANLGQHREFAREVDKAMEEAGDEGVFTCPACLGRGLNKGFLRAEALAAHMSKEHPAPKITEPSFTPDDEPLELPEPTNQEAPMTTALTEKEALDDLTELFEDYYASIPNKPFTIDRVIKDLGLPDTTKVRKGIANRVMTTKKRQEKKPHLFKNARLENVGRGTYKYVVHLGLHDEAPNPKPSKPEKREPEKQEEPTVVNNTTNGLVIPNGRLYEWVAETADGRHIVKDDQGKVYFASFTEI